MTTIISSNGTKELFEAQSGEEDEDGPTGIFAVRVFPDSVELILLESVESLSAVADEPVRVMSEDIDWTEIADEMRLTLIAIP